MMPRNKAQSHARPELYRISKWLADESGAVAILFGLVFPLIIAGFALAAETGYWLSEQRRIQSISDVVAYSVGVDAAQRGADCNALQSDNEAWSDLEETAWRVAEASGLSNSDSIISLRCVATDQIGIDIDRTLPTLLVAAFSRLTAAEGSVPEQLTINPSATAIVQLVGLDFPGGSGDGGSGSEIVCIHALAPSGVGLTVFGTTQLVAPECRVQADSTSRGAMTLQGNITYDVACSTTQGTHRIIGGAATIDLGPEGSDCAEFRDNTETAPLAPTLAELQSPEDLEGVPLQNLARGENEVNATFPHSSGQFMRRFDRLELKNGTFTFSPGLYIIDGGEFTVANNAVLLAPDGVGFFLVNGAEVLFGQQAVARFGSGISDGAWEGLVLFSEPPTGNYLEDLTEAQFTAEALDGILYLPGYNLDLTGGLALGTGCFSLVAETIDLGGNTELALNCDAEQRRKLCSLLGTCGNGNGTDSNSGVVIVE